jgi:pyruvate dehydrogenase E2 component (dihydrolipoamide acetyltransferase)
MEEIYLPKASLTLEEAQIVEWLHDDGDEVEVNEPLVEMETDKGIFELPAPRAGTLHIRVREGTIRVGDVIGFIGDTGDEPPSEESGKAQEPDEEARLVPAETPEDDAALRPPSEAVPTPPRASSPLARKRALDLGIALTEVEGSGPGGRITAQDVSRHADTKKTLSEPAAAAPREPGEAALRARRAITAQVAESWRRVPHINIGGELRAESLQVAYREGKRRIPELTYTDLLLTAFARAIQEVPELNGTWEDDRFVVSEEVHLGFAAATPVGVLVPVIREVVDLKLEELTAERSRLAGSARRGELKLNDMQGGTATLSNLGAYPVDFFTPVINAPQACLLASGRILDRPVAVDGALRVQPTIWANVALDHRAADGISGGRLLLVLQSWFERLPELVSA